MPLAKSGCTRTVSNSTRPGKDGSPAGGAGRWRGMRGGLLGGRLGGGRRGGAGDRGPGDCDLDISLSLSLHDDYESLSLARALIRYYRYAGPAAARWLAHTKVL